MDLIKSRSPTKQRLERSPETSLLTRQQRRAVQEGSKSVKKPQTDNVIMSELDSEIDRIDRELLRQENENLKQARLANYRMGIKLPSISPVK